MAVFHALITDKPMATAVISSLFAVTKSFLPGVSQHSRCLLYSPQCWFKSIFMIVCKEFYNLPYNFNGPPKVVVLSESDRRPRTDEVSKDRQTLFKLNISYFFHHCIKLWYLYHID